MPEYQYPLAHRVIKPIREYVPSWRQDAYELQRTLDAARVRNLNPRMVHVGTVIHGKLVPAYMPKD